MRKKQRSKLRDDTTFVAVLFSAIIVLGIALTLLLLYGVTWAGTFIALLFLAAFTVLPLGSVILEHVLDSRALREELRMVKSELSALRNAVDAPKDARPSELIAPFTGLDIHDIARACGKPEDTFIGRDDLPHKPDQEGNDLMQMWVSLTGDVYHRRKGCHQQAIYPCNAASVGARRPCPRCRPNIPDLSWHAEYMKVIRAFEEGGLPHPSHFKAE